MRPLIGAILICATFLLSFIEDDAVNLYRQSLKLYIGNSKVDTIYVIKCPDIKIPKKIDRYILVDVEASEQDLVKQKGTLNVVKLMPIELSKDLIEITLVDFVLTEENKERVMRNFGSITYSFRFDAAKKSYRLIKKTKYPI